MYASLLLCNKVLTVHIKVRILSPPSYCTFKGWCGVNKIASRWLAAYNDSRVHQHKFRQRVDLSYVIHPRNLAVGDRRIFIPPYMSFCL